MEKRIADKFKRIRMLITDVDGVLTDGSMYYAENGDELKRFTTLDGGGILLLRLAGIDTAVITSEDTAMVGRRMQKLGIDRVYQGEQDKVACALRILKETGLSFEDVCFIGDDINDVPLLMNAGVAVTVPGHTAGIDRCVDFITTTPGGSGAVRELAELILGIQGKFEYALQRYYEERGINIDFRKLMESGSGL